MLHVRRDELQVAAGATSGKLSINGQMRPQ
jgi:hypothetical protein